MRYSKFDRYRIIFEQLRLGFDGIADPKLKELTNSWLISFSQMDEWLSDPKKPVTKSMLAAGLEQGLLDTYYFISKLSSDHRARASRVFSDTCAQYYPDFLNEMDEKSKKILSRGKIKNESEWHLVRGRVDELMLVHEGGENLELYQKLLDDFEGFA